MPNITDIPAPRVAFIDQRTGLMSREWYRFFLNLFMLTGSGTTDVTLADLQVAPSQGELEGLLPGIEQSAQLASMVAQFDQVSTLIQGVYVAPVTPTADLQLDPLAFAAPQPYYETQRAFPAWGSSITIASGFGTSAAITAGNGMAAFSVNVGTGGTASDGVIGLPTAPNGWKLCVENITATAANRADQRTVQTASTTTSATVQNQTISSGASLAWTASDVLLIAALAY